MHERQPARTPLPDERRGVTYRFSIMSPEGEKKFYLTAGLYNGEEERLGELFIKAGKEGSFISAALDLLMTTISIGLQHGIPLQDFTRKMRYVQCEPASLVMSDVPVGLSGGSGQKFFAKSPFDYIAALLDHSYPDGCRRKL